MGRLYLTPASFVFHASVLGFKTLLDIPLLNIR